MSLLPNHHIMWFSFDPEKALKKENKKQKKREPNMFIAYRNEMMKSKPQNITMAKFSKLVSIKWKQLSKEEKDQWQRRYQINRDRKSQRTASESLVTDQPLLPEDEKVLSQRENEDYTQATSELKQDAYL